MVECKDGSAENCWSRRLPEMLTHAHTAPCRARTGKVAQLLRTKVIPP